MTHTIIDYWSVVIYECRQNFRACLRKLSVSDEIRLLSRFLSLFLFTCLKRRRTHTVYAVLVCLSIARLPACLLALLTVIAKEESRRKEELIICAPYGNISFSSFLFSVFTSCMSYFCRVLRGMRIVSINWNVVNVSSSRLLGVLVNILCVCVCFGTRACAYVTSSRRFFFPLRQMPITQLRTLRQSLQNLSFAIDSLAHETFALPIVLPVARKSDGISYYMWSIWKMRKIE